MIFKKNKVKKENKKVLGFILIFLSCLFIVSARWAIVNFNDINFFQIIYFIKSPSQGTSYELVFSFLLNCIPMTVLLSILTYILVYRLFKKDINLKSRIFSSEVTIRNCYVRKIIVVLLFIISTIHILNVIGFSYYLETITSTSDFIEENYVDPRTVQVTFPEKKRNLIYIFLESMETTYDEYNLIPELDELRDTNINFSTKSGAYPVGNSTWTIAALVAQHSGIPLNIKGDGNSMDQYTKFLPGLYNLGDMLIEQGYQNYYAIGSDSTFGGRKNYFSDHGKYNIWDLETAISTGRMTAKDSVFWGYDDTDLFKYSKEILTNMDKTKPFNLTLLTVNTHFPDGYLEPTCAQDFDSQYKNVIACSSKQVSEFVKWIQTQDFYENTTIVISGDHNSMNTSLFKGLEKSYERTVYSTIINSPIKYTGKDRLYSTYDLFPTTVYSLGATIEGNRLGLGTNLYSEEKTLLEQYGYTYFNDEISKSSDFYVEHFSNGFEY